MHLNYAPHKHFYDVRSNQDVQWFNVMIGNLGLVKNKKIEKYSDEKQEDPETKCCLHSVLLYFALQDASYFHVLTHTSALTFS